MCLFAKTGHPAIVWPACRAFFRAHPVPTPVKWIKNVLARQRAAQQRKLERLLEPHTTEMCTRVYNLVMRTVANSDSTIERMIENRLEKFVDSNQFGEILMSAADHLKEPHIDTIESDEMSDKIREEIETYFKEIFGGR